MAGLRLANKSISFLNLRRPFSGLLSNSTPSYFGLPTAPNKIASASTASDKVSSDERDALLADSNDMENPELEFDLPSQEIRRPNGAVIKFEIDPFRKKCLLEGLDDIGITMQQSSDIKEFETKMSNERPWL